MKPKKVIKEQIHDSPKDDFFWLYLGNEYYRRMQPTPYTASEIDIKKLKEKLKSNKN
jgi:hypothetical protein